MAVLVLFLCGGQERSNATRATDRYVERMAHHTWGAARLMLAPPHVQAALLQLDRG